MILSVGGWVPEWGQAEASRVERRLYLLARPAAE